MTHFVYQRTYRGPLQAVLLDWAGTTLDYGCYAPAVVFMESFKRMGVPISMAEARGPMGTHKKEHIRQITQMPAVAERWQTEQGRKLGSTERYAVAKMALFQAFDQREVIRVGLDLLLCSQGLHIIRPDVRGNVERGLEPGARFTAVRTGKCRNR